MAPHQKKIGAPPKKGALRPKKEGPLGHTRQQKWLEQTWTLPKKVLPYQPGRNVANQAHVKVLGNPAGRVFSNRQTTGYLPKSK